MAAEEALGDPFGHFFSITVDEEHHESMQIHTIPRLSYGHFKKEFKPYLTSVEKSLSNQDVGQVAKKNPGFDPVFMKV